MMPLLLGNIVSKSGPLFIIYISLNDTINIMWEEPLVDPLIHCITSVNAM